MPGLRGRAVVALNGQSPDRVLRMVLRLRDMMAPPAAVACMTRHASPGSHRTRKPPWLFETSLKMGDPRRRCHAKPVEDFDTPELKQLLEDMFDTMKAANGAGLAAPQIGVDLQVVVFGFQRNERYPEAPPVPMTVLINPTIEPLSDEMEEGWEGCLSVPGCAASCRG